MSKIEWTAAGSVRLIEIAGLDGEIVTVQTAAVIDNLFALHKSRGQAGYTVTHIPSKLAVVKYLSWHEAEKLFRALAKNPRKRLWRRWSTKRDECKAHFKEVCVSADLRGIWEETCGKAEQP